MPLLIIGFVAFIICAWILYRTTSLTGDCRWREDRRLAGPDQAYFRCLVCGAEERLPKGKQPRHCRRQQ